MSETKGHTENPELFEHSDVNPRTIFLFIGALFVTIAASLFALAWLFGLLSSATPTNVRFTESPRVPPQPRIQVRPELEMKALRAEEDRILGTYGWADQARGTVRLPIDRAMKLLVQRGLPTRGAQPLPTAPAAGPASGGPQTGRPAAPGSPPVRDRAKEIPQ